MDRQALREKLLDLLEQETWERPEAFDDSVNLREGLKLDSVDLLSVALRAERELKISINSADFEKVTTVGDLLNLLSAKLSATKSKAA